MLFINTFDRILMIENVSRMRKKCHMESLLRQEECERENLRIYNSKLNRISHLNIDQLITLFNLFA